jgi:two-component system, chemotaxis family, chemotaxis protein CheY
METGVTTMKSPADVSVLVFSSIAGISRTIRMALRGVGVRSVQLAANNDQMEEAFAVIEPDVLVVYVDGPESDSGLDLIQSMRRSESSPNRHIPIVAVSPRRDVVTVNAVINAGGHEYVLFPASGDMLLKKVIAARQTSRPFIEQPNYIGPCRRRRNDPLYAGPERRAGVQAEATGS